MALIKCPECGEMNETKNRTCKNCGRKLKKRAGKKILVAVIIVLFVILIAVGVIVGIHISEAKTINKFYSDMKEVQQHIEDADSMDEMRDILLSSGDVVDEFENANMLPFTLTGKFAEEVKSSSFYELYLNDYVNAEVLGDSAGEFEYMFIDIYRDLIVDEINGIVEKKAFFITE